MFSIKQDYTLSTDLKGVAFYYTSLSHGPDLTLDELQTELKNQEPSQMAKLYNMKFGWKYLKTNAAIEVSGLAPKRTYKTHFYYLNTMAVTSGPKKLSFTTLENSGEIARIDYVFIKSLSAARKKDILCLITEYFSVLSSRVINYALETCKDEDKPHDIKIENNINVELINNTYTYSYYVYPNLTNSIDGSNTQIQFKLNQPEYRDWMINKNITEFTQI